MIAARVFTETYTVNLIADLLLNIYGIVVLKTIAESEVQITVWDIGEKNTCTEVYFVQDICVTGTLYKYIYIYVFSPVH